MQQPATEAVALVAVPRYADWLTPDLLAAELGTSSAVVTNWIVKGIKTEAGKVRMRAVKVGGRWRIEPSAVAEFVAASTSAALPRSAAVKVVKVKEASAGDRAQRTAEARRRMRDRGWIE